MTQTWFLYIRILICDFSIFTNDFKVFGKVLYVPKDFGSFLQKFQKCLQWYYDLQHQILQNLYIYSKIDW